ncbi:hypothetical protein BU25DRAFT_350842 [Macroventuria anomochaeta]|uniref:Uncharacterized protein n=1 Tax=Macroventuria anomochaeta TaxID=301207 RepID=A0ACB6RP74_9PLEO|nr:uncharacterized protein BU25DRAFT_350842 [Macroventuria anomochaeta]KAF2623082.1 hypothetical protein BU25DRAFT_350842 [Macroventuria anomochaeta]
MSSDKANQKPSLSKSGLQSHGIHFIEKVHRFEELEDWIQPISYQLTRKRKNPPKEANKCFRRELRKFQASGQDRDEAFEGDWSLGPGKTEEGLAYPEQVSEHEDVLWNEFPRWARLDPEIQRPTQPKPDLTYAFKIIETAAELYPKYKHDPYVESFSLPWLSELRNRKKGSVISSPTTKLHQVAKNKRVTLDAKHLMCFPWAIVEVKHGTERPVTNDGHMRQNKSNGSQHEKRKQFCYCQAANASAAGLTLREDLAVTAKDNSRLHDALVMFSFTCVGPTVKLWITYREKPVKWVYLRIKPEISRWIRIVHEDPPQTVSLTPSGDAVVQRRRAVSCEPLSERLDFERWDLPAPVERHLTPRAKAMPPLPRGKTAPESFDRWKAKANVPKIQLNGYTKSNTGETDDSADEGYSSVHTSGCESEEDEKEKLSAFVCDDEPSENDESDASYIPPSSEDESTESESAEEEELDLQVDDHDSKSGEDSSANEDIEDHDLSDDEGSYHRLNQQSSALSRLDVYYTPTKNLEQRNISNDRSKKAQSPSQRSRRCSSRF